jgi:hypothetical protein
MPTFGVDLSNELSLLVDKAYTGYLDPAKQNRLFLMAYINLVEKKYNNLDRQQVFDELSYFIKTGVSVPMRNGKVYTQPLQLSGVSLLPNDVVQLTSIYGHELVVGDIVNVSGVQGLLNLNGGPYVVTAVLSPTVFEVIVIGVTGVYVLNSGSFTSSNMLPDYHHLLSLKASYVLSSRYSGVKVIGAAGTPVLLKLNRPVDFRTGELMRVSGVTGNVAANGDYYVKRVGNTGYELFIDEDLQLPVSSVSAYNGGGVISRVLEVYATPYVSDQKISSFGKADKEFPKYEVSQGMLKVEPAPSSIELDYMTEGAVIPTVRIDVLDSVTDLELYYPKKLLVRLVNEAADLQHLSMRDLTQYQAQTQETIENP